MYPWLLLGHLLGVLLFVTGSGVYGANVDRLPRAGTVAELRSLLAVAAVGSRMLTVGAGLLIVAGLVMTATTWSFTESWIIASIALVIAQGASGLLVDHRVGRLDAALKDAADGPVPAELAALSRDRFIHVADRASIPILAELVFLMTLKPGPAGIAVSLLVTLLAIAALAVTVSAPAD